MLPSLLEGPMLFWLPGGPMLPSIPMTWSGLRIKQQQRLYQPEHTSINIFYCKYVELFLHYFHRICTYVLYSLGAFH